MKSSQHSMEYSSKQREKSRIERLQKNARFGEIVFTKHGVYEARPCEKCTMHHRVFYPPVLVTCEGQRDVEGNQCSIQTLDHAVNSGVDDTISGGSLYNSPSLSRTDSRSKKEASSIFRGTGSMKRYLSGLKCLNMELLHGQSESQRDVSLTSPLYPKYSRHSQHEVNFISRSSTSLDKKLSQRSGCEICLLAEENKLCNIMENYESASNVGGSIQGAVQCPTCSQWMSFQANSEEDMEKLVKKEVLVQEEEALKQRLAKGREKCKDTLQKLKTVEEKFEKIIADVADAVSDEIRNVGDEENVPKNQVLKCPGANRSSTKNGIQEFIEPNKLGRSVHSPVQTSALSNYLSKLPKSQSDVSPRRSISDIVIVLNNDEKSLTNASKMPSNKCVSYLDFGEDGVDSNFQAESKIIGSSRRTISGKDQNSTPSMQHVPGDSSNAGRNVSLQTERNSGPNETREERHKSFTPQDTNSSHSMKKISFAGYSEGEEIKPIDSGSSSNSYKDRLKYHSDEDDDCLIQHRQHSLIEHVDSLILIESSMSLRRSKSQLDLDTKQDLNDIQDKQESKKSECLGDGKEGFCFKGRLPHRPSNEMNEHHDTYVHYGTEEVIPQSDGLVKEPTSLTSKTSETHSIMKKNSQHSCKHCEENTVKHDERTRQHKVKGTRADGLDNTLVKQSPPPQISKYGSAKEAKNENSHGYDLSYSKDYKRKQTRTEQEYRRNEPPSHSYGGFSVVPPSLESSNNTTKTEPTGHERTYFDNCEAGVTSRTENYKGLHPSQPKKLVIQAADETADTKPCKSKSKSSAFKYSGSKHQEKLHKKRFHHSKKSHYSASQPTQFKDRNRKTKEIQMSNKAKVSSSKPPIYGGGSEAKSSGGQYEKIPTSCPPTYRSKNRTYRLNVPKPQEHLELAEQEDQTSIRRETSLEKYINEKFGRNYSSRLDCMEAQSKLDNQLYPTTDSEVKKSLSDMVKHRQRYKHRSVSLDSRQRTQQVDLQPRRDLKIDLSLSDIESSLSMLLNPLTPHTGQKSKTRRRMDKRQSGVQDQIVELHVGQASLTDDNVRTGQFSGLNVSNTGVFNSKQMKIVKPNSETNVNQSKDDLKTRREALLHHLLMNEAQQSIEDDNDSVSTSESGKHESLHVLVGKFKGRDKKTLKSATKKDHFAKQKLPINANSKWWYTPTHNSTEPTTKEHFESLPEIIKTQDARLTNPNLVRRHTCVPPKIESSSSSGSSNMPKVRRSLYCNSRNLRRSMPTEDLDSRTQIIGIKGISMPTDNDVTTLQKTKCLSPPECPQFNDARKTIPTKLPPIPSMPSSSQAENVTKSNDKRPTKKVVMNVEENLHCKEQECEDQSEKSSILKRLYNSIFKQ